MKFFLFLNNRIIITKIELSIKNNIFLLADNKKLLKIYLTKISKVIWPWATPEILIMFKN